jgi:hypothetical protein
VPTEPPPVERLPDSGDAGGDKPAPERHQIAAAVQSLEHQLHSDRQNPTDHERLSLRWSILTGKGVMIYTFLTVGIAAASICSAWEAREAVRLTVENFIVDQRPYVSLTNNLGSPTAVSAPDGKVVVIWTWHFTNYGKTPANHVTYSHFMRLGNGAFEISNGSKGTAVGGPVPPTKDDFATVISEEIEPVDFTRYFAADKGISIAGTIDYFDAHGRSYETTFCVAKLSSGAIAYEHPMEHCDNEIK